MHEGNLPKHVAFILDGNRRWAREKKLPTFLGHKKGYEAIEPIIDHAIKLDIPFLTFWAFSTENWKRDKNEVTYLLDIFRLLLKKDCRRLHQKGVKVSIIGQLENFPEDIVHEAKKIVEETKGNKEITVTIGLSYGGRTEIVNAINKIIQDNRKIIDEQIFSEYLYTNGQPDPDLIIRTGGEQRLSGFLPWQSVYSELYFTKTYWPDFTPERFDEALEEYNNRQRRFGR